MPSQVVLTSTVEKSKSALYSICNRILFQVCAKIGGEPWALNDLPFFFSCTTAVGYHVFDNLITFTCSLNQKATRYWSKALPLFDDGEQIEESKRQSKITSKLQSLVFESMLAFKLRINTYPTQMIVYTNARS